MVATSLHSPVRERFGRRMNRTLSRARMLTGPDRVACGPRPCRLSLPGRGHSWSWPIWEVHTLHSCSGRDSADEDI